MTETGVPHTDTRTDHESRNLVEALLSIGSNWARYGLGVAKLSLETSARTLGTTARVLGDIADKFDATREQKVDPHDVVEHPPHDVVEHPEH